MSLPTLTSNAIQRILENGEDLISPVLQITQMKRMNPDDDIPRFKILLTDGRRSSLAMATHAAAEQFPPSGRAEIFSIIKLTEYQPSVANNKKVLIVMEFELVMPGSKVGRSLMCEESAATVSESKPTLIDGNKRTNAGQVSSTRPQQSASTAPSHAQKNVHPIESLTPYQNRWSIRARVTDKRPIKNYSNARGQGKLFSVDLADATGEIRATAFNQECDRFFEMLKENEVYYIRGGQIKAANRQFSSLNNDYELTFSSETQIDPCYEEITDKIPAQQFNFVPFSQLQNKPKEALIDVIGVVDTVSQCETITSSKTQKEFRKRNIRLIDDSNCSVALTLWGEEAEKFEENLSADNLHPIIAVKGVRIGDFQGLSLSMASGGKFFLNPDRQEAYKLRGWYDSNGSSASFQNLSAGGGGGAGPAGRFMLIAMADAERLGTRDSPDYFTIKGTISALRRENCLYKACPTTECNKKLLEMAVDSYRCEKCNKEFANFKWRLMLTAQVQDFSGQLWVTFFEDMAQSILGYSSEDLGDLKKRDEDAFNAALNKSLFKSFMMKVRAKMETYNDETRIKHTCVRIDPLKNDEYIRILQEDIKKLEELPLDF